MNEQQKPETSDTQSSKTDVEAPVKRSFLYHIRANRLFQFSHSLAMCLKPNPAKKEETVPSDHDATTAKKQPPKPDIKELVKGSLLYRLKKAAHRRLPRFFHFPISSRELNILRNSDSKINAKASPPDDEFVDLYCMWAVEFYTPAHIDALLAKLRKLDSKNKNHSDIYSNPTSWIQNFRQNPNRSGWLNLGVIHPQGTDNFMQSNSLTATLPTQVQYATGRLFSLTSSLTCIVIGFVFEKDFSTQFDEALRTDRQTYTKPSERGYTIYDPERQKTDHICQIRAEIAELAARWFRENLPGLFSSGILEGNLPTCEFVTLRKAEPFPLRSKDNTDPSGYHYLSILDMYFTSNVWLCEDIPGLKFADSRDLDPRYHSIFAIRESDLKKQKTDVQSNSDRFAQILYIDDLIKNLLSRWAVLPLLEGYSQHLNAVRDSALFRSKSRQNSIRILKTLNHHVSYSVDIAAVTADLISYMQKPSSFSSGLGAFKPCDEQRYEADYTLDKVLYSAIKEHAIWLQKTDQALRDHLTQYGSLLGAKENVRLQRTIRFLTWVILVLTLLTVVLSWPELQKLWSVISQWLQNLW